MKNNFSLNLTQKQDLSMTAELRQAIEMLALSAPEIADLVAREVAENPCLEYEDRSGTAGGLGLDSIDNAGPGGMAETDRTVAGSVPKETTAPDEAGWQGGADLGRSAAAVSGKEGGALVEWDAAWDQWAIRDEGAGGPAGEVYGGGFGGLGDEEGFTWENRAAQSESLNEYLRKQYDAMVDEPKLRVVGHWLIEAIDEAGYLRADLAAVAAQLRVSEELVDDARALIQTLEPAGIGARDLAECLRLQLHARGQLEDVTEVCLQHLDLVASKQWTKLAGLVNALQAEEAALLREAGGKPPRRDPCDAEEVQLAVAEIQKCAPKPALLLLEQGVGGARVEVLIPDVVVTRRADAAPTDMSAAAWDVALNGAAFPRLLAFPPAKPAAAGKPADEARKYLQERYGRAKWLQQALEQRAQTTLAVARAVVRAQPQFFAAGVEFMVPLTLRTVAEMIGVHESTVSRVASGKSLQTPWGVIPLRTFFASGVASSGGQEGVASTSVQAMIGKLVKAEDPKKPLSDEQIVLKLRAEGVEVARRTVAKYRAILRIPGTSERRVRGG